MKAVHVEALDHPAPNPIRSHCPRQFATAWSCARLETVSFWRSASRTATEGEAKRDVRCGPPARWACRTGARPSACVWAPRRIGIQASCACVGKKDPCMQDPLDHTHTQRHEIQYFRRPGARPVLASQESRLQYHATRRLAHSITMQQHASASSQAPHFCSPWWRASAAWAPWPASQPEARPPPPRPQASARRRPTWPR